MKEHSEQGACYQKKKKKIELAQIAQAHKNY